MLYCFQISGMELELPNRLYGEGLEPQVKKINNSCRLKLLELLKEKMEPEFDEVMKDPICRSCCFHDMRLQRPHC